MEKSTSALICEALTIFHIYLMIVNGGSIAHNRQIQPNGYRVKKLYIKRICPLGRIQFSKSAQSIWNGMAHRSMYSCLIFECVVQFSVLWNKGTVNFTYKCAYSSQRPHTKQNQEKLMRDTHVCMWVWMFVKNFHIRSPYSFVLQAYKQSALRSIFVLSEWTECGIGLV